MAKLYKARVLVARTLGSNPTRGIDMYPRASALSL
jgi:hypothetical protein